MAYTEIATLLRQYELIEQNKTTVDDYGFASVWDRVVISLGYSISNDESTTETTQSDTYATVSLDDHAFSIIEESPPTH